LASLYQVCTKVSYSRDCCQSVQEVLKGESMETFGTATSCPFMWLNIIQAKLNASKLASGLLPLQYMNHGVTLGELQGSLCALLLVLRCIVALLADHSGSIFTFLRIIADSRSLSSLPAGWFYFMSILERCLSYIDSTKRSIES